ncbi:MAG: dipeptide ABC transporter ATP-binding protein [Planctomycetota bacterium]
MAATSAPLLQVKNLKKYFPIRAGLFGRVRNYVKAVDGVSFDVAPGETLGLVGESGCGKTTVGRSILRLIEPSGGDVTFDGHRLQGLGSYELRNLRRDMQIIFQDPYSSLNPRMTVEQIIGEAMTVHGVARGEERRRKVGELLERCGLSSRAMGRYPHEFSGGQRQRVGIARALALNPKFIVCDEAVSALDVSIQAQVINLLMDIQEERGLSYLFIAHDLSVVEHISTRVAVMYLGHVAEMATSESLYANPLHPYTRALLSAVPVPDPSRAQERIILDGDPPTPINPPSGCVFHPRCWLAEPRCKSEVPELRDVGGGHVVACHLVDAQKQALMKDGVVVPVGSGKKLPTAQAPEVISVEEAAEAPPEEQG